MRASAHVVNLGQGRDLFQMRQASAVDHCHAEIIDQLLGDENVRIPGGVEDFADGEWRGRVLADDPESFLQLCRDRVLKPKEMIGLKALSQTCGLDRSEPVVHVMQQVQVVSKLQAESLK